MIPQKNLAQFSDSLFDILNSSSVAELDAAIAKACRLAGFDRYIVSVGKSDLAELIPDPTLSNFGAADIQAYLDHGGPEMDPLLQHFAEERRPLAWNRSFVDSLGNDRFSRMIGELGLEGGVNIPLPAEPGTYSVAIFLSLRPPLLDAGASLSLAHTLAHLAQQRLESFGKTSATVQTKQTLLSSLSDKQLKILHWIAAGKSNADIATILDLSRKQVDYHVREILRKLDVSSRIQAAAVYASQ